MSTPQMYQIEEEILQKLVCSECSCFLSCGPIRLKVDGGAVCGRCLLSDNFISDTPFENVAKMLLFPCRYKSYGCKKLDAFNDIKTHEDNCDFKEYKCPLTLDGTCEWIGPQKKLLKHGEDDHAGQVLKHPCALPQIFARDDVNTYITSKDNYIFLIYVKVCLSSGNIYHCVRFVGDTNCASHFEFTLNMLSNITKLTKFKAVVSFNSVELPDNSLVTSIAGLQEISNELENINFVISIKNIKDINKCTKCNVIIKKFVYRTGSRYRCENCNPVFIKCPKCDYKDLKSKIVKHQKHFCKNIGYKNSCLLCKGCFILALEPHFVSFHKELIHDNDAFWKTRIDNFPNTFSNIGPKQLHGINSELGLIFCEFFKFKQALDSNVVIHFNIYAPLSSDHLNLYDCHIVISRADKNFKFEGLLEREVDFETDWTIKIDYFHYYDQAHELDIKISFVAKDVAKHPNIVATLATDEDN